MYQKQITILLSDLDEAVRRRTHYLNFRTCSDCVMAVALQREFQVSRGKISIGAWWFDGAAYGTVASGDYSKARIIENLFDDRDFVTLKDRLPASITLEVYP